jgi:glycine C-acetyltransferase
MFDTMKTDLQRRIQEIREGGLYKHERVLTGPQGGRIDVGKGSVINFCANNYLGLASHPSVVQAAHAALDRWGYGLSSVRFICGTQEIHTELERRIAAFLGTEAAILYSSCFDANGGFFEALLGPEDAIISDALNHASIIDGVRLCKAQRFVYENCNMENLESVLKEAQSARYRVIATDGVFSMDGTIADLQGICRLAEAYDALVFVDDSHAVGFIGDSGRGTHELRTVMDRVDVITGTLGKALGGASGGYTAGPKEIIDLLRQRSRPYLFSNTLAPVIAATSVAVLDLLEHDDAPRLRLRENTRYFRSKISGLGLSVPAGEHPIVPIMLGDARSAHEMAEYLLERGVYVIGFSYPVVPKGKARIRTQVSAAHSREDLDYTLEQLAGAKRALGL